MKKFNKFKVYISSVITLLVSSLVISFVAFTYAAYLNHETHKHTINVKIDYSEYFDKSSQLHTYVIKTPEHINNLSKLVAMGVFGPNDTFLLGGNIDCSTFNDPLIPIGSDDTPFYSVFDGQGYTISNLKVVGNDVADIGMFGYVANGATIKNFLLDSPIVSVTGLISNYSEDSYLIRNNNPFRKKFGDDLYSLAKSFSLNPTDNTSKAESDFTQFKITYETSSNAELRDFPIKAYVSKSNILTEGSDFNFALQQSYSGDSQYFTIEMYIEGLVFDSETKNYFYSRISLEKFKVYLNVVKDSNGKITSKGFVKNPEDIHVYKKTIETLPTHIITDKPYNYYNQHVVNAGIVVGHLDGNTSYIGVKNGTLKANNRPYRSNSILIGKKIDDDDVSSLSREHVNFTENAEIGDELQFGSPSTKAGAIDSNTQNRYISNIYTGGAYGFTTAARDNDYLKIYGSQNQTTDANNLKFVKMTDEEGKESRFLSFRDSMECYLSSPEAYNSWLNYHGSKNFFRNNCISMWVTTESSSGLGNVINNLLNNSGDFYLNFNFDYILYDNKGRDILDNGYSKAKLNVVSSSKRKQRNTSILQRYDYYSATGNQRDPDENNIVYYDPLTVPIGSRTTGIPGYIDSTLDENPLSFKKEDVVACDSVSPSSFISTDVKHKNITVVSNTDMFNFDFSPRGRTPIFCIGLDLSDCVEGQEIAFNILDFTVTLSSLNGNYSSEPLTVDYFNGTPQYNNGEWSNWPMNSNVKVQTSCFSKLVDDSAYSEENKTFSDYPVMTFVPKIPSNYTITTSRSSDTNNVGVITISYSNSPHADVNPTNDPTAKQATITAV